MRRSYFYGVNKDVGAKSDQFKAEGKGGVGFTLKCMAFVVGVICLTSVLAISLLVYRNGNALVSVFFEKELFLPLAVSAAIIAVLKESKEVRVYSMFFSCSYLVVFLFTFTQILRVKHQA